MLGLLLFYQGGYVLLFQYFIYKSDKVMSALIMTDQYKDAELIEIKIPVKLPSVNYSNDYQQISGQFTFKGQCYNYVKLKVSMDTMYLKVIPNAEKTRLVNAGINYGKQVNDEPVNKKSHLPLTKKNSSDSEHYYTLIQLKAKAPFAIFKIAPGFAFLKISNPSIAVTGQPPDMSTTCS